MNDLTCWSWNWTAWTNKIYVGHGNRTRITILLVKLSSPWQPSLLEKTGIRKVLEFISLKSNLVTGMNDKVVMHGFRRSLSSPCAMKILLVSWQNERNQIWIPGSHWQSSSFGIGLGKGFSGVRTTETVKGYGITWIRFWRTIIMSGELEESKLGNDASDSDRSRRELGGRWR